MSLARVARLTAAALLATGPSAWANPGVQPAATAGDGSKTCNYHTYQWSVLDRRATAGKTVSKAYADVTDDERDPANPACTVCREDQVKVEPARHGLPAVAPFWVCHAYAADVRGALEAVAKAGDFQVVDIVGYRVGRTRGAVVAGLRTEWSNHSFGGAVDINARFNGLYDGCDVAEVNPRTMATCKLRVGGPWDPHKRPKSTVTAGSSVYREFKKFWKWGGEIKGSIRDTMHFSATGY